MFRHTALFPLRPDTSAADRAEMLRGLASLRESPTVCALELGENVSAGEYHVAVHLDFDDADGYAAYYADPGHKQVAAFNASISFADRIARVDYLHEDEAQGDVRHVVALRGAVRVDAAALAGAAHVASAIVAENASADERAWDRIVSLVLPGLAEAHALLESDTYREALAADERAAVTHVRRRE